MSADNWAVCPRCSDDNQAEVDRLAEEMKKAYGKVTAEEFVALTGQFAAARDKARDAREVGTEFREDYEIYGAEDGVLKIRYGGHCRMCGLDVQINIDHPFYPEPAPPKATDYRAVFE